MLLVLLKWPICKEKCKGKTYKSYIVVPVNRKKTIHIKVRLFLQKHNFFYINTSMITLEVLHIRIDYMDNILVMDWKLLHHSKPTPTMTGTFMTTSLIIRSERSSCFNLCADDHQLSFGTSTFFEVKTQSSEMSQESCIQLLYAISFLSCK